MRDKERIKPILETLERIWRTNPDYRLGQLLVAATKPATPCPELFYLEDDELLEGLNRFEHRLLNPSENTGVVPSQMKYTNIAKVPLNTLNLDLVLLLIHEIKADGRNRVITPIHLMQINGAPVADQTWLLSQKPRIKKLKQILVELESLGLLERRKSKQDFLGIKEIGYNIVE